MDLTVPNLGHTSGGKHGNWDSKEEESTNNRERFNSTKPLILPGDPPDGIKTVPLEVEK